MEINSQIVEGLIDIQGLNIGNLCTCCVQELGKAQLMDYII